MRGLLLLLFMIEVGLGQSDSLRRPVDGWFRLDKLKHFSTSFYLTTTSYYFQARAGHLPERQATKNAVWLSFTMGLGKEFWDRRKPQGFFSWRDLVYDALGITGAVLFIKVAT